MLHEHEFLIDRLDSLGLAPRAYSGRHMYRKRCVGVVVPHLRDLAMLGPDLHPGLEIDNFGFEFIAYWPMALLPESHDLLQERDVDEEPCRS